ncbi:MAG: response regulator [Deltaproteobacteria bacterium]|nr:response regulator [Deltaproteobacteria bacterium]
MKILVAEDDRETLRLFENTLKEWGHTVYPAKNGMEAWEKLMSISIDMVFSSWIMPEMGGQELCRRMRAAELERYIYFITIAEEDTREQISNSLETGADDYIVKPLRLEELKARLEIGARIVQLEREADQRYDEIRKNYFQTISMFTSLIEVFDEDLGGHCRRVGKTCLELARRHPDVSEQEYQVVEGAGFLHDIGMIGLPNVILSKKRTERNDDERRHYLTHPARGEIILHEIELLQPISKLVRSHHEQFNGRGFPDGLAGDEISILAMIVSAASIYDNFIHRGKVPREDIPANLQRMRGYQLEPFLVDLLLEINLEALEEQEGRDFLCVAVGDLKDGMMLAKDIRMKTGALAMPGDTELTGYGIRKLNSYRKLECIADKVYVYNNSMRG